MHLVIDASNIISGGGLTHLKEFIRHAKPLKYGFDKIALCAPDKTLDKLPQKSWLEKKSHNFLNKGYLHRFLWKQFILKPALDEDTLLFIPGTGYESGAGKVVTMCRNLLPLDVSELNRYKYNWHWFRLRLLRFLHLRTFEKADGIIFLNKYCMDILPEAVQDSISDYTIVPHGVNKDFLNERDSYETKRDFKLLNISSVSLYRHQWKVAEAVFQLRENGYENVSLELVGPPTKYGMGNLNKVLEKYPNRNEAVKYHGKVSYEKLSDFYEMADGFIFSSTCETFGLTLLEAMAHSLPIACSAKSSMPAMLEGAGMYFNPEDVESIKNSIVKLINNKRLRKELGKKAHQKAKNYSWQQTTDKTFKYLQKVANS